MSERVFENWTASDSAAWGKAPVLARHTLATSDLFQLDRLADLIDAYPRDLCDIVHTSRAGTLAAVWREGEIGDLAGREMIEWIQAGQMWLNLRRVQDVDRRYAALLNCIFSELEQNIPGFGSFNRSMGILISSPLAKVPFHCDLPGQSLWQISGRKRFKLYPAGEPCLRQAELERIALYGGEVRLTYDPGFDAYARVIDLEPGQMVHWPLHAPHSIENLGVLNVSMTIEHWTRHIRRMQMVTTANAVLRNHLGVTPRSTGTEGAAFMAKAALQAGWRRSPWVKAKRRSQKVVDFRLDPTTPGKIVDIPRVTR
ncbi:MAG: cupin-like domain-containing protein [Beijerinckiaceae bacterium]|nr:cupin-like domain-containing protein [Beijerinckiaceae bacterium]